MWWHIESDVNWDAVTAIMIQEMEDLVRSQEQMLPQGPTSPESVGTLSVSAITQHMQHSAPHLFGLLSALTLPPVRYQQGHHHRKDHEKGAVFALSTLMKLGGDRAISTTLLMTLMMIARGTNRQICC